MNLVVFGLTISSSWGNGHATLWRGLFRALVAMGHRVTFFERNVAYYASTRDMKDIPGGELVLYDDWASTRPAARRAIAAADATIVTSYCADAVAILQLLDERDRGLAIFYDLDTPVTLSRLRRGEPVPYIGPRGLRDFDLVLSFTGGGALDELRTGLGARRVAPLYGHVDPDVHRRVEAFDHYRSHLSYLGTYAADRQEALEAFFVEPAKRCKDMRFAIGGAQYPAEFPWSSNIYFVRHLPAGEHSAFFSSSRLTLNVTRRDMAAMGWCPSGRLFEATACGCPVITDAWPGLDSFFGPDEVLTARDTEDVIAALNMDDTQLQRVAMAARERTLSDHTSRRRAAELVAALERASASPTLEMMESR
ncbi:MAG: glycosyltransferase [Xanthobacteraceae bacterium]|nr:glycosyltransferase [Xanthobacteraceae bacterium]